MDADAQASSSCRLLETYTDTEKAFSEDEPSRLRPSWLTRGLILHGTVIVLAISNVALLFTDHLNSHRNEGFILGQDPSYCK